MNVLEDSVTDISWSKGGCDKASDNKTEVFQLGINANKWDCLDINLTLPSMACEWHIAHGGCFVYTEEVNSANGDSISLCFAIFLILVKIEMLRNYKW